MAEGSSCVREGSYFFFFHPNTAKNRYQLEVPDSALGKNTPDDYTLQSQRKGFRRYWTPEIEEHLSDLMDAEDRRDVALKDTMRTIFQSFDQQ